METGLNCLIAIRYEAMPSVNECSGCITVELSTYVELRDVMQDSDSHDSLLFSSFVHLLSNQSTYLTTGSKFNSFIDIIRCSNYSALRNKSSEYVNCIFVNVILKFVMCL